MIVCTCEIMWHRRFDGTDLFDKILQLVTSFLPQEQ